MNADCIWREIDKKKTVPHSTLFTSDVMYNWKVQKAALHTTRFVGKISKVNLLNLSNAQKILPDFFILASLLDKAECNL